MYVDETSTKMFIWSELLKRDFYIPRESYLAYMDKQYELGTGLLSEAVGDFFEANSLPFGKITGELKEHNPELGRSLPNMCAFGYSLGKHLHLIRAGSRIQAESVALASGIFNMGIALFDYIIDETSSKDELLTGVNIDFLGHLMDPKSEGNLKEIFSREEVSPVEQLLTILISGFGLACKAIFVKSQNIPAWNALQKKILELYLAEKETSVLRFDQNKSGQYLYETFRRKSVMPFETISNISWLAEEYKSDFQREKMQQISRSIGNTFWIADDLSDIAGDTNAGIPGYITIKFMQGSDENKGQQTNLDLTGSIKDTIQDLITSMDTLKTDSGLICGQEKLCSQVLELVRMYVYTWLAE